MFHVPESIIGLWFLIFVAGSGDSLVLGIAETEGACNMHKMYTTTLWEDPRIQSGVDSRNLHCVQLEDEEINL